MCGSRIKGRIAFHLLQLNPILPMKGYTHLSDKEREIIEEMVNDNCKQKEIAEKLGRPSSTISREINRNKSRKKVIKPDREKKKCVSPGYKYSADKAQQKTKERRKIKGRSQFWWKKQPNLRIWVEDRLKEGWSPIIISGRAKLEEFGKVSHEAIYQYIYSLENRHKTLFRYLVRSHKRRKKKIDRKSKKISKIPNRIDIDERPILANERLEVGHWESDSVVGPMGTAAALHTEIERATRLFRIRRIPRKTAENTANAMIDIWKDLPPQMRKSATPDNGSEFCAWQSVRDALNMLFYFAKPHHSWERGANERANGLIRRFFPKKTNFDLVSDQEIQKIEDYINNRPMKCLGFLTPNEAFQNELRKIALDG